MGTISFSGMEITVDYFSMFDVDARDYGYGFISWFFEQTKNMGMEKGLSAGGEFLLLEYGVYFCPQHGTIFAFMANTIYHATRKNVGFTQITACGYIKLVNGGKRKASTIGLG